MSNNLIVGFTSVRDDRDPIGQDFPFLEINDGEGNIRLGSERFSTANQLDQDILTITDNFKIFKGDHTITIGTHNEFYSIYNLFIRQNFGYYEYESLDAFYNDVDTVNYERSYSLVDDITGDGSAAAADFNAMQLGVYIQDEWSITPRFTVTGGVRLDVPIITSDPEEDTYFNNTALPAISKFYDVEGARAGQAPDGQLMFSPRLGFNYELSPQATLRGGAGIFTSRIPFVWPGAMFNNNGLTIGEVTNFQLTDVSFIGDPRGQYTDPDLAIPGGQMDLFVDDFKYPQVLRGNLAVDFELPAGIAATVEGIYTKTLNNIVYTNINTNPVPQFFWNQGNDDRPVYSQTNIDETYTAVYLADNTDEGYTYTATLSLNKAFDFGLNVFAAYTYGDAEALNEGTSSQNSSQWRGQIHVDSRNNPVFGRSDFSLGHRVVAGLNYRVNWLGDLFGTTFSLFLNAQSGQPFSYVYNTDNPLRERGSLTRERTLIYIPASENEINLIDTDGATAAEQWAALDEFIEQDEYLSENRGSYAEKNANRTPFESIFDFRLLQDVNVNVGGKTHTLQLSADIFNFANLLNPDWGVDYDRFLDDENALGLINFAGYGGVNEDIPQFTYTRDELGDDIFDIRSFNARWRMQVGVRYIFR